MDANVKTNLKQIAVLIVGAMLIFAAHPAQLTINVGSSANDGTGDTLRGAFGKVNTNFTELYTYVGSAGLVAHCNTVAELQAYNPTNARAAVVRGYWTANDGGGGVFFPTNTITSTNLGTRIVSTNYATWSWERGESGPVNVKWFGAKGDGATDDTAEIQSAINAGRGISTPRATYLVSRPAGAITCLSNYTSGFNWIGNGATIRLATGTYSTNSTIVILIQGASITAPITDISIRDLIIDGNHANQGTVALDAAYPYNGLQMTYVNRAIVDNVTAKDLCHDGIATGGSANIRIINSMAFANGKNGIYVADQTTNVVVSGCTTYSNNFNFGAGAYLSGVEYSGIAFSSDGGGVFSSKADWNGRGILAGFTGSPSDQGVDFSVMGNTCLSNAAQGIYVIVSATSPATKRRISVIGNTVRGSANSGIVSYGSGSISIVGNVVSDSTIGGITVGGTDENMVISGNTIDGTTTTGIYLRATTNVTVVGNSLNRIGTFGIEFAVSGGLGTNSNLYATVGRNSIKTASSGNITGYATALGLSSIENVRFTDSWSGSGSPLNVIVAPVGSIYHRTDGGANTSVYIKEADPGASTGWVAK